MPDAKFPLSAKEILIFLQEILSFTQFLLEKWFFRSFDCFKLICTQLGSLSRKVNFLKRKKKIGGDEHFIWDLDSSQGNAFSLARLSLDLCKRDSLLFLDLFHGLPAGGAWFSAQSGSLPSASRDRIPICPKVKAPNRACRPRARDTGQQPSGLETSARVGPMGLGGRAPRPRMRSQRGQGMRGTGPGSRAVSSAASLRAPEGDGVHVDAPQPSPTQEPRSSCRRRRRHARRELRASWLPRDRGPGPRAEGAGRWERSSWTWPSARREGVLPAPGASPARPAPSAGRSPPPVTSSPRRPGPPGAPSPGPPPSTKLAGAL